MKKCVFAGTFDPPTVGHRSIIDQSLSLFDEVVVAVMVNTSKKPMLTLEQRLELLSMMYGKDKRVRVIPFSGAVVDLLHTENTPFYVRGVRDIIDFTYENENFYANCHLMPDIITLYIPSRQEQLQISSTLVRNSVVFEKEYRSYMPEEIYHRFEEMMKENACLNNK